ncbi:hypothetical protein RUND412_008981 [Rhizina undulata]
MLPTLPSLSSHDAHSFWYQPRNTFKLFMTSQPLADISPSPASQNIHPSGFYAHSRQSHPAAPELPPSAAYQSIARRKLRIGSFGSTWTWPSWNTSLRSAKLTDIAKGITGGDLYADCETSTVRDL